MMSLSTPYKLIIGLVLLYLTFLPFFAYAATLGASPATGVYTLGNTFTIRVVVNTSGQSINAAEGTLTFNPRELSVVRVDRSSSVFNLWVTEPAFSNSAGTISFSGGSPTGYSGSAGTVFTITFKSLTAGPARLAYSNGSVLANDGRGTNVLSAMNGGTYTIEAATSQPAPEVVIEYVAPANTPAAPLVTSTSHPEQNSWFQSKRAVLSWQLPSNIESIRTLLDKNQNSIPSRVYETPIQTITLEDLEEGVSYFHIQYKNADGWGKVGRYRIGVDTIDPVGFAATLSSTSDPANPEQALAVSFSSEEKGSPITRYRVSINGAEPLEILDEDESRLLTLPALPPGYYTLAIEAIDAAGNTAMDTIAVSVEAFEAPIFTEYPSELGADVIPVIRGETRSGAEVTITLTHNNGSPQTSIVQADESGVFTFIPESTFAEGVYRLSATAKDTYGAQSEPSPEIRIAVQKPGYLRLGNWLVSALSVIIPLGALVVLLITSFLWSLRGVRKLRGKVAFESHEALDILDREFDLLLKKVDSERESLAAQKRTKKLSPDEAVVFETLTHEISSMRQRVTKEVRDVEDTVTRKK